MKHAPIITAVLTASLLLVCFTEYGFRGLNPDIDDAWVAQPAWWRSNFLADLGLPLWGIALAELQPFEPLIGDHMRIYLFLVILFHLLNTAIIFLVVFAAMNLLLRLTQPNHALQRTAGERPSLLVRLFSRRR